MVFDNSNNSIINGGSESLLTITSSLITSVLFLASLSIFLWLTIKSKSIRNFQSQISLFIAVYVIGELLEINSNNNNLIPTTILPKLLPPDIGSQIHVAATILLTLILWMRFYYFNKSIKELVVDNNNNSGTAADKDSNDSQQ